VVLFPWLSGVTLLHAEGREGLLDPGLSLDTFSGHGWARRGWSVFWLFLPALALWRRRGWVPVVVFPSLALLILLVSPYDRAHSLSNHYSANVLPPLVLGMVEAVRRRQSGASAAPPARLLALAAVILMTLAAAWAFMGRGALGYRLHPWQTRRVDPGAHQTLQATRQIPRQGILLTLTGKWLAGFCANRADILVDMERAIDRKRIPWDRVDHVFVDLRCAHKLRKTLRNVLRTGEFGVTYFDGRYAVLQRGRPIHLNDRVLLAMDNPARARGRPSASGFPAEAPGTARDDR
jgi:hypothetical protein